MINSYYVVQFEGEESVYYKNNDSDGKFFTDISKIIAFRDCTDEDVTKIIYRGEEIHYCGWEPGMIFEFANSEGVVVWTGCFPHWDH